MKRKEYVWKNISLQKLMYMIIYDTLEKMFRKSLKKKKNSWNICVLKKVWGVQICDISENPKTCENGEMMSPYTLYRKLK